MTARRAVIGLSLLCALVLCAIAAPSAMATKGTTAFTCEKTLTGAEFEDAHCDKGIAGTSGFKHTALVAGTPTSIVVSNQQTKNLTTESTPAKLTTTIGSIAVEIVCLGVTGTGTLENQAGPPMKAEGTLKGEYTGCTVTKPAGKCKVKEPIKFEGKAVTKVIKDTPPEEMGLEVGQIGTNPLYEVVIENISLCPIVGTYQATGSYIGTAAGEPTGKGATFTTLPNEAMSPVHLKGAPAFLSQTLTFKMSGAGGEALTVTTTAS